MMGNYCKYVPKHVKIRECLIWIVLHNVLLKVLPKSLNELRDSLWTCNQKSFEYFRNIATFFYSRLTKGCAESSIQVHTSNEYFRALHQQNIELILIRKMFQKLLCQGRVCFFDAQELKVHHIADFLIKNRSSLTQMIGVSVLFRSFIWL